MEINLVHVKKLVNTKNIVSFILQIHLEVYMNDII